MDFNNMDFSQILSQAKKLKEDLDAKKKDFATKEFTGTSGGGLVSATINGEGNFTSIKIDKTLKQNASDDNTIEDLVLAAVNAANTDFKKESQDLLSGFANIPGAADILG